MDVTEDKITVHSAKVALGGGLASFLLVCVPIIGLYLAMAAGLGGVIMAVQAMRIILSDRETYKGMGLAIAGLVISSISVLVFWGIFILNIIGAGIDILGML